MTDTTLSEALKEAYASAPSDVVIIQTLELLHPAFDQPIRVVSDYIPIDARLEPNAPENPGEIVTFQPFSFGLTLPEVFDKGVPELSFNIDNVSGEIIKNVKIAMTMPQKLEVICRLYLSTDLDSGPQNNPPLQMTVNSIQANAMRIEAKASILDFANKKFPNNEYDERRFPGLIAE